MLKSELLSFEEITRMTRLFIAHRFEKIRPTGGEPLLRKNRVVLIGMLAARKTPAGKPLYLPPHQRLAAGQESPGVQGRGSAARQRLARFAR